MLKGICRTCHKSFQYYGCQRGKFCSHPCYAASLKIPIATRFWSKVEKTPTCWIWKAFCSKSSGYGQFSSNRLLPENAHRVSWKLTFGNIPKGMYVLHHCDNRPCVRPSHLFLGSQKDNCHDAMSKMRHCYGERNGNSKLTDDAVRDIRKSVKLTQGGYITGESVKTLTEKYHVQRHVIGAVFHRRVWKHIK